MLKGQAEGKYLVGGVQTETSHSWIIRGVRNFQLVIICRDIRAVVCRIAAETGNLHELMMRINLRTYGHENSQTRNIYRAVLPTR